MGCNLSKKKVVISSEIHDRLSNYKTYKTIRKKSHSFPMHHSCSFIFKNDQYENNEIALFANRAIKHHNNTKDRENQ